MAYKQLRMCRCPDCSNLTVDEYCYEHAKLYSIKNQSEKKLHKVTIINDKGREKQVKFPIEEDQYRDIKKQPKGVQKSLFSIMYSNYLKELKESLSGGGSM